MLVQHILLLRARIEGMSEGAKVYEDHYADARAEIDRLRRILAALREPSANVIESANVAFPFAAPMVRAAVAAAEQEVEG